MHAPVLMHLAVCGLRIFAVVTAGYTGLVPFRRQQPSSRCQGSKFWVDGALSMLHTMDLLLALLQASSCGWFSVHLLAI